MKAKDLMNMEHLWTCSATTDIRQAAQIMQEQNVGCLPVLDDQGRLEGIVTDRDIVIRLVALGRSFETPVREIMTKPVHTISPDADAKEVEQTLEHYRVRRVPVVDELDNVIGIISIADLAKRYHGLMKEHRLATVLETVSSPE